MMTNLSIKLLSTAIAISMIGFTFQLSASQPSDETMNQNKQADNGTERIETPLKPHAWENRPLLIFAPAEENSSFEAQMDQLNEHRAGLMDRDMVIYQIFKESGLGPFGRLTEQEVDAFRKKYDINSGDQTVILVGKDTTEKLRESPPVEVEKIFKLIDGMPMRQREMQNNSSN